jgi:hypothetical protein
MKKLILALTASILVSLALAEPSLYHSVVARKKAAAGGGGGTSPGTTNLVAWYDFNDSGGNGEVDSHSTYNLTENNTPTYQSASSPEYGTSATTNVNWSQTSLDDNWANTAGDYWYVLRFQALSGIGNNDPIFISNSSRMRLRWSPTGGVFRFDIANIGLNVAITHTEGVWYHVIGQIDDSAGEIKAFINESTTGTTTDTDGYLTGTVTIGGSGGTGVPARFDYMGFFTGLPTADNITWLYNSGGTRVYGDL